jgi:hypothetical protein
MPRFSAGRSSWREMMPLKVRRSCWYCTRSRSAAAGHVPEPDWADRPVTAALTRPLPSQLWSHPIPTLDIVLAGHQRPAERNQRARMPQDARLPQSRSWPCQRQDLRGPDAGTRSRAAAGVACAPARRCHGSELPGTAGGVVDASASRACSRARISSGVYAPRRRWSRAITTPPAATLAKAARPSIFHHRMCLGYDCA